MFSSNAIDWLGANTTNTQMYQTKLSFQNSTPKKCFQSNKATIVNLIISTLCMRFAFHRKIWTKNPFVQMEKREQDKRRVTNQTLANIRPLQTSL